MTALDPAEMTYHARRLVAVFEQTGDTDALTDAVDYCYAAIGATPEGDSKLGERYCDLGAALWRQYEHADDLGTLYGAVRARRAAVSVTAAKSADYGVFLSHLALTLRALYWHTGDLAALDEAITHQAVVAARAADDPAAGELAKG